MDMFYRLSEAAKRSAIRIKTSFKYDYIEEFKTPLLLKEATFKIYEGKKFFDIIGFAEVWNFAISMRVKNLLEEYNITGWSCYPIKIENIEDNYFGFHIDSQSVPCINRDKDGLIPMFEPILINMNKYDYSDFFIIEDTGIVVCVPKVKELFEKAKITNVEFCPL